jgi:hypothetical protein
MKAADSSNGDLDVLNNSQGLALTSKRDTPGAGRSLQIVW